MAGMKKVYNDLIIINLYSTSSSGANSFSSHANSSSGFALQMAAAQGNLLKGIDNKTVRR